MAADITGNMNLPVPPLTEPGPAYAQEVNQSLVIISDHTHDGSENGGSVIDLSQQVVNADLSINEFNLTNVKSLRFLSQPAQLNGAQDVNCLYVNQNELGFNNSNGVFIPITDGNTLAISSLTLTNFSARLVSASTSILPTDTYNLINVNTATNTITINLPIAAAIVPVAAMRLYIIRDIAVNAGSNPITLHAATGNTFADSGSQNFVISNDRGYVGIYTDGVSKWYTWTQNMYNNEVVKLVDSILSQTDGLESKTTVTSTSTDCAFGVIESVVSTQEVGITLQGTSIDIQDYFSTPSTVTFHNNSVTTFNSGSELVQNLGAQGTFSGQNNVNNGFININYPSVVNVNGGFGGGIQLQAADSMTVNASYAIILNDPISIATNAPRAIWASNPVGIVTAAAPSGNLTSGIGLGGGDADYPCFTDASGSSNPRTKSRWIPLIPLEMFNNWNTGGGNNWEGTCASTMQITQIPVTHNGATLDGITVLFTVQHLHASIAGLTYPRIQVWRQDCNVGQVGWFGNRQYLSTVNPQAFPTPVSSAAYYNDELTQSWTYSCDQNNVIDTENYLYFMGIVDEQGVNSEPGNQYYAFQMSYSNIVDMRFPT